VLYSTEHLVRLDNISVLYEEVAESKVNLLINLFKTICDKFKSIFSQHNHTFFNTYFVSIHKPSNLICSEIYGRNHVCTLTSPLLANLPPRKLSLSGTNM